MKYIQHESQSRDPTYRVMDPITLLTVPKVHRDHRRSLIMAIKNKIPIYNGSNDGQWIIFSKEFSQSFDDRDNATNKVRKILNFIDHPQRFRDVDFAFYKVRLLTLSTDYHVLYVFGL